MSLLVPILPFVNVFAYFFFADVLDMNKDLTNSRIFDYLTVNHVKAMSRRVWKSLWRMKFFKKCDNELGMNDPRHELNEAHSFAEKYLIDYVKMHPAKSVYGFSSNRKKPGHFNLSFLANKGIEYSNWGT